MRKCDIVLVGVGGQGILFAAEILGSAAIKEGFNVRVGEIHGMAQRGGAMVCHVRINENAHAPTIMKGMADVIVGIEPLEVLRNIMFASKRTLVLLNTEAIIPSIVSVKGPPYPSLKDIMERVRLFTENVVPIDAASLARKAGSVIAQNMVMLGALAATHKLPMKLETLKSVIRELAPSRYIGVNIQAFKLGYDAVLSLALKRRS